MVSIVYKLYSTENYKQYYIGIIILPLSVPPMPYCVFMTS